MPRGKIYYRAARRPKMDAPAAPVYEVFVDPADNRLKARPIHEGGAGSTRPRAEGGVGPGYEERIAWIEGELTFETQYVRAVSNLEDSSDRGRVYDFVIPWHSIFYIEVESEDSSPYSR